MFLGDGWDGNSCIVVKVVLASDTCGKGDLECWLSVGMKSSQKDGFHTLKTVFSHS